MRPDPVFVLALAWIFLGRSTSTRRTPLRPATPFPPASEIRPVPSRKCDPVGAVEIAQRLGVSRRTVDQWRQRDLGFPEPRWLVGGRPAWNYDDVEAWANARGDRSPA